MLGETITFITLEEYKQLEGINSPNNDVKLKFIIDSVNALLRNFLEYPDSIRYTETYNKDEDILRIESDYIFSDLRYQDETTLYYDKQLVPMSDIIDSGKGYVELKSPYRGIVEFSPFVIVYVEQEPYQNPAATPAAIKMAAYNLVTHYYKDQYRASVGSGTQSVSYTPSTNNIPRHVIAMLAPFRPI